MLAIAVYTLCALTAILAAALLVRAYLINRSPLLMWSAACFVGLGVENALFFLDLAIIHGTDLSLLRYTVLLGALSCLLYGFIWDLRR